MSHRTHLARRAALPLALLVALAGTALASNVLTSTEKSFVDKAIALNNESLDRASVVESSADNYVLDYAEQIVADRHAANTELAALAQSHGYRSTPAPRSQSSVNPQNQRRQLTGAYAPVPYFEREVRANQQAVALYQAQADRGNTVLRGYTEKYVSKLRGELQTAQHLLHVELGLRHH